MSRDINKMHPVLRERYDLWTVKMKEAGLNFMVLSVDRSIVEQMALYAQGRMKLIDVNIYRIVAAMPLLNEEDNHIVTRTLQSKHITNMFDKDLNDDLSRAVDFALKKDGIPHWQLKSDVNSNEINDYVEAGKLAESVGLISGRHFNDYGHIELGDKDV